MRQILGHKLSFQVIVNVDSFEMSVIEYTINGIDHSITCAIAQEENITHFDRTSRQDKQGGHYSNCGYVLRYSFHA